MSPPVGSTPLPGSVPLLRSDDGGPRGRARAHPVPTSALGAVAALDEIEEVGPSLQEARQDAELDGLALLAAAGDGVALERLVEKMRPAVVRYCRGRLGSGGGRLQTAEDVAQDALWSLCSALPRYRPGTTRVLAFAYGIASNKVVDAFRAAGRDHSEPTEGLPDVPDSRPSPEAAAVLRAQGNDLWALLDLLPAPHREILVMRVALGYSAEQTARVTGSTAGAVRVTQHRALAKLRILIAADQRTTSPRFTL